MAEYCSLERLRMKYTVSSKMFGDLIPVSGWITNHPFVFQIWRGFSWLIAGIAYLGVLIAPTITLSITFQVIRALRIRPPSILYWVMSLAILFFTLWWLYRCVSAGYHFFHRGVINLDAVFMSFGVSLAVVFMIWILPTGAIPTPPDATKQPTRNSLPQTILTLPFGRG